MGKLHRIEISKKFIVLKTQDVLQETTRSLFIPAECGPVIRDFFRRCLHMEHKEIMGMLADPKGFRASRCQPEAERPTFDMVGINGNHFRYPLCKVEHKGYGVEIVNGKSMFVFVNFSFPLV